MPHPQRISLAHRPTPIVKLERLSKNLPADVFVWRDDWTGSLESGNKIRKLEFYAADAVAKGATRLITCGGPQSNHARATAWVARRLGLSCTVVVRKPAAGMEALGAGPIAQGNFLLTKIAGAHFRFVDMEEYEKRGSNYDSFLEEAAEAARQENETPYVIPEGGSGPLGCFGYIAGIEEMLVAWRASGAKRDAPTAIFCALGSGGTLAGLHLGLEAQKLAPSSLYAVNVCDSAAYFQRRVGNLIETTASEFRLRSHTSKLQIFDGHFGAGYAATTDTDFLWYVALAREEGLLLDPVYTGKAFRGMVVELEAAPAAFGDEILFVHTGGMFGTFAFAEQYARALGHPL